MVISESKVRERLRDGNFRDLFIRELGWDHYSGQLHIELPPHTYDLTGQAEKRGMAVFVCSPAPSGAIPDAPTRRKMEKQAARSVHEHIIIYVDAAKTTQVWQWVKRDAGKPDRAREYTLHAGQSGEPLIQRLRSITFALEEEGKLDLVEVTGKVRAAFDVDRVTKRFYDRFKTEHDRFLGFIQGIKEQGDREWYASLMLNRLMFVYFIRKKGFLDGDSNYLRSRLRMIQERRGKDQFLSFYRHFLLRLFHEGLGQSRRTSELDALLGTVPYLNGGLFDVHQLEQENPAIEIADDAFHRVFAFFDQYEWHLDTRPLRKDNEINPDVLGYIFEKYINQKQMGAYYTKEDITGYIAKNTVIPFLFDEARKRCAIAFEPGGSVWTLLSDNPDRYIYESIRKGVDLELPANIAVGVHDVSKRQDWNRRAGPEHALPTETWREHVARRQRCYEIHGKLASGDVSAIHDLIAYNLDIVQFAEDVIDDCEGPELLRAFYKAIESVTILDPTCGSGAFLFAALNILEPLYGACLDRMQAFVEDLDRSGEAHSPHKFRDFRDTLRTVADHPSRPYFILKSIILSNLFGVDIMEEAVEIAKLRLFLTLVAQVESRDQIEPLPDIDFNIRAGNTLVGFARYEDAERAVTSRFDWDNTMDRIRQRAEDIERLFDHFRKQQTEYGGEITRADKQELRARLKDLDHELNRYLASEYGIDPQDRTAFACWRQSHQPFHWFVEFYGIMKSGGFDVVIGNPPWKEYATVRKTYTVLDYKTERCGNLHNLCTERSLQLRSSNGWFSFIVQLPLTSSSRMAEARHVLRSESSSLFVLPFGDRPGKLFEGLENCRSVIFLSQGPNASHSRGLMVTRY